MSLATRCTACGTVFRVVQDQLRVSEGWVRCGRCAEVFNAVENLVDPPLTAAGGPTAAAAAPAAMARVGGAAPPAPVNEVDVPLDDEPDDLPAWARSAPAPQATTGARPWPARRPSEGQDLDDGFSGDGGDDLDPGSSAAGRDRPGAELASGHATRGAGDAQIDDWAADPDDRYGASSLLPSDFVPSALPGTTPATPAAARAEAPTDATRGPASDTASGAAGQALPSFVRRADRAARWQQPRVRAALAALVLLSLLGLVAQAAHSYRDLLAARWPATQPLLAQACARLGCTVQAPRLIDALVVDSSGLLRVERSNVYKLSVTLRNRDALAVALPALDLSLTDTQGRLLARRVLRMDELGQTQTALSPGAELVLQATLQTADASPAAGVAGYTIDLFYP